MRVNQSPVWPLFLAAVSYFALVEVSAARRYEFKDSNRWQEGWSRASNGLGRPAKGRPVKGSAPYIANDGLYYGKRPPQWLVPLFYKGDDRDKTYDAQFVGYSIRLTPNTLLAHDSSVRKAMSPYSIGYKPSADSIAICGFDLPDQIDEDEFRTEGNNFFPYYKAQVFDSFSMYRVSVFAAGGPTPTDQFPIDTFPNLPSPTEQWTDQCYLLAYGRRGGSSRLYLNQIYLNKIDKTRDCSYGICTFDTHWTDPNFSGTACGSLSLLGAPVICEQGNSERLSYLVTSTGGSCLQIFHALDVSKHAASMQSKANEVELAGPPRPGWYGFPG